MARKALNIEVSCDHCDSVIIKSVFSVSVDAKTGQIDEKNLQILVGKRKLFCGCCGNNLPGLMRFEPKSEPR